MKIEKDDFLLIPLAMLWAVVIASPLILAGLVCYYAYIPAWQKVGLCILAFADFVLSLTYAGQFKK